MANTHLQVTGLFGVLPTPFLDDGSLDLTGLRSLVDAQVEAGATGLTALGFMGEASELDEGERKAVVTTVRERAAGCPMVVGVTADSVESISERSRAAVERGAGALMISPCPSVPLGEAVAAAAVAGVPLIVQDYPAASGVQVSAEEIVAVADSQPLIAGAKIESPPTSGKIAAIRRLMPRLAVVGGLGGLFLIDELRAGATGVMTGAAVPERLVAILRAFPSDPVAAERDWIALLPLLRLEAFTPHNLAARKEVWRQRGVIGSAYCRRAGASLDEQGRDDVRRALVAAGLGSPATIPG